MKILITGGAGFIGSNIVDFMIEKGYDVVVVDNLSSGKLEYVNKKAKFYKIDLTDEYLWQVFDNERLDLVIHEAAQVDIQKSIKDPVVDAKVNILGTINLLECCRKYNLKKIIYASSAAVYGDPLYLGLDERHRLEPVSFYGISKYTGESYLRIYSKLYGLKYTILRYSNVYGIRQDINGNTGVISSFIGKMLNGDRPIIFGDGNQTRDFVYVKDVVYANYLALYKGENQIINISTNNSTTINKLVEIINGIMDTNLKPIYLPARTSEIEQSYLNNIKAFEVLGWVPQYSLEQGLREMIDFYMLK
ncbi:UDP-glucose 4-epimerase [Thermoanaerobacterium xylanolyticum LX-11]|uniref:UDP-glucose 4-epimerase n=1 Tax=Thermoanaerobacterium xylanolyticum (strain ATCC 49914 / DSM 7097 / LX-11) TaxID=858215 RepID=F6BH98_THEXL|nr:NAD-dependent epimerase/dehydratase family protein [Thermoanaerobacterium xylanolyticum]AEF17571.1 UDP-glucose 4-epimerase [Thermoanaerobacterium xylanolyticum LX-11]